MTDPQVSPAGLAFIEREEVSSRSLYEKRYRGAIWPGVRSGVTIGKGYDLGYQQAAQFRADWRGVIPDAMLAVLEPCCGVTGPAAKALLPRLRGKVDISWDAASHVFAHVTVPRYCALLRRACPNTDKLPADSFTMLLSLVFNRGASFALAGDRYREMRNIRAHMSAMRFDRVADEIRAMSRIWGEKHGLSARRRREADFFERGLRSRILPAWSDNAKSDVTRWEAKGLQQRLAELGYAPGEADGNVATATTGALAMFQRDNGLPVTGFYDDATRAAMAAALPRVVSEARANATAGDLREKGSATIAAADGLGAPFKWLFGLAGIKGAEQTGAIDAARGLVDQASAARLLFDQVSDLASWALQYWWLPVIAIALAIWFNRDRIVAARVADHRSGRHMGR